MAINPQLLLALKAVGANQSAFNEAKKANETRYNDILSLIDQTRTRVMGDINSYGQSRIDDTNRDYDTMAANDLAALAQRGMPGSSRRAVVQGVNQREKQYALNNLEDQLRRGRADAEAQYLDRTAGVMERRTDDYPQNNIDIAGLIGQIMAAQRPQQQPVMQQMNNSVFSGQGGGGQSSLPGVRKMSVADQSSPQDRLRALVAAANARRTVDSAPQQELAMRQAQAGLKMAMDQDMGSGFRSGSTAVNNAQLAAIMAGLANWAPAQPVPVVPGAPPALLNTVQGQDPRIAQLLQQLSGQPHNNVQYYPQQQGYGQSPANMRASQYQNAREAHMNSRGYQDSLARRNVNKTLNPSIKDLLRQRDDIPLYLK